MNSTKRCQNGYHAMIVNMVHQVLKNHDINHIFLPAPEYNCPDTSCVQSNSKTVYVLPTSDHLSQQKIENILKKLEPYQPHPILILTAVHNAELDYPNLPKNISFIHIGGDMLFQMDQYPTIRPQREKNENMSQFWISLSLGPRVHRILTACCLLGQDLGFDRNHVPETGLLKIAPVGLQDYSYWTEYYSEPHNLTLPQEKILQKGFEYLRQGKNGGQPGYNDYVSLCSDKTGPDNATNFKKHLSKIYFNSLVELVNETSFFNQASFITEKYLNSVYGYNLPIIFSTAGTVNYLRQQGFDMFDNVIDHSYDSIQDPLQRIFCAIESNKKLLTDKKYAQQAWQKSILGLDSNYKFASTKIYDHFTKQVEEQLLQYISKTSQD